MAEHTAFMERDAAYLAIALGYSMSGSPYYEVHCIPEKDAHAFNAICDEQKVARPSWIPPLPERSGDEQT